MMKRGVPGLLLSALLLVSACSLGAPPQPDDILVFEGPPMIHIASPLPNQTFQSGSTVIVQARIENAGPDLVRISMLLNGAVLGEKLNPNPDGAAVVPVTIDWPTSSPGQFLIGIAAEREDGTIASDEVSVLVIVPATVEQSPAPSEPTRDDGQTRDDTRARDDTGTQDDTQARDDAGTEDDTQASDDTGTADEAAPDAPAQDTPIAPAESATEVPASPQPTATITRVPPPQQSFTPVKAVINTPANLRLGPGTEFDLVGSISVNEEVEIVAVNAARDWYHIRYGDFGDAWIYSELVRPSGEVGAVPVDPGPAPPQPEVDNLPTSGVNLVIDKIIIVPEALVCNETGQLTVRVRNVGAADAEVGGNIVIQDTLSSTGELIGEPDPGVFPPLPAGESRSSLPIPVDYSAHTDVEHRLVVTIDSDNHIAESNEEDNSGAKTFLLRRGNCP